MFSYNSYFSPSLLAFPWNRFLLLQLYIGTPSHRRLLREHWRPLHHPPKQAMPKCGGRQCKRVFPFQWKNGPISNLFILVKFPFVSVTDRCSFHKYVVDPIFWRIASSPEIVDVAWAEVVSSNQISMTVTTEAFFDQLKAANIFIFHFQEKDNMNFSCFASCFKKKYRQTKTNYHIILDFIEMKYVFG